MKTINREDLKLSIDAESVNIYIDNGEEEEPTNVCYWYFEEWEEDQTIIPSIFNAILLYHSSPNDLLILLGLNKHFIVS